MNREPKLLDCPFEYHSDLKYLYSHSKYIYSWNPCLELDIIKNEWIQFISQPGFKKEYLLFYLQSIIKEFNIEVYNWIKTFI